MACKKLIAMLSLCFIAFAFNANAYDKDNPVQKEYAPISSVNEGIATKSFEVIAYEAIPDYDVLFVKETILKNVISPSELAFNANYTLTEIPVFFNITKADAELLKLRSLKIHIKYSLFLTENIPYKKAITRIHDPLNPSHSLLSNCLSYSSPSYQRRE